MTLSQTAAVRSLAVAKTLALVANTFRVDVDSPVVSVNAGREGLHLLWKRMGARHGAEVGVWKGGHAERICQATGVQLLVVDPWAPYAAYRERKNDTIACGAAYLEAQARLEPYHCTFLRQPSVVAAKGVPNAVLDFVYIDGNHEHEFVAADLQAWTPTIRPGGILSGHDYHEVAEKPFIQVKAAVDAHVRAHNIAPLFVLTGDRTPSFFWVVP